MYPESFLWWLGGTAIIFGILGLMILLAFSVESWIKNREKKKRDEGNISMALLFLSFTAILVALGCAFYVNGSVGFAQFLWVLASGTAGAGCVLWIEK